MGDGNPELAASVSFHAAGRSTRDFSFGVQTGSNDTVSVSRIFIICQP